jgi:23S rRNA (cytidine1920-2'-O)/16S rRNA (cytidine1409-2'-O)-methyltransferase
MARRRLDAELVRRGLVGSRTEAREAVRSGLVNVAGRPASKPSTLVDPADPLVVTGPPRRYVSRGGDKLAGALDRFGVDVAGLDCLDAGASTGGFTDCLLDRGAARVIAADVGYGQLAWQLRQDPRVTALERTNIRDLDPSYLPFHPRVVTADLSFISLRTVLPALVRAASPDAVFVLLVKPQFEAGRAGVGSGGVVRDPGVWRGVLDGVAAACRTLGLSVRDAMASPLLGPAGNVEFFLLARRGDDGAGADLDAAVREGLDLRADA